MKNIHILFINIALTLICLVISTRLSYAQNGNLDLSFGNAGKVTTDFGGNEYGYSVALQSDGKIIAAGTSTSGTNSEFVIARYNINGSLDNSFGTGGKVTTHIDTTGSCVAVALQSNGKILALGYGMGDIILTCYNTDGSLDTTFGIAGKMISDFPNLFAITFAMTIQNDGKIVVTGAFNNGANYDVFLVRYSANGILDSTFGNAGMQMTPIGPGFDVAYTIALQTDGKIVVGATTNDGSSDDFAVLRYNTNGILDNSFGNGGIQITPIGLADDNCRAIVIQSDGKIIACGFTFNNPPDGRDITLVRYNTNGTLDNTFGIGGIVVDNTDSVDFGRSVAVLSDGKIIVGGSRNTANGDDFVLTCFNTNGTLDLNFGIGGSVTSNISGIDIGSSIVVQNNGFILLAGSSKINNNSTSDFALARYIYDVPFPENVTNLTNKKFQLMNHPNPFSIYTTLQSNIELHDASIFLYNISGQQVRKYSHLYGKEIIIYRDKLPSGLYSIRLIQNNNNLSQGSLIIRD